MLTPSQGVAFCRDGICAHILLTRWMEGDASIKLASVSEYCAKHATPTVGGAEAALRARLLPQGPLVRRLPTRSAWTTLAALVQQAKARAQKRREQASQTKRKLAEFWHSPNARGPEAAAAADAAERAEQTRHAALTRAVARVQSPAFAVQMDGISDLSSMAMTLQEAQELRAHDTVRLLLNDTNAQQAIRLMAKQLLERWESAGVQTAYVVYFDIFRFFLGIFWSPVTSSGPPHCVGSTPLMGLTGLMDHL